MSPKTIGRQPVPPTDDGSSAPSHRLAGPVGKGRFQVSGPEGNPLFCCPSEAGFGSLCLMGITVESDSESTRLIDRLRDGDPAAVADVFTRPRNRLRRMVEMRLDRRLQGRIECDAPIPRWRNSAVDWHCPVVRGNCGRTPTTGIFGHQHLQLTPMLEIDTCANWAGGGGPGASRSATLTRPSPSPVPSRAIFVRTMPVFSVTTVSSWVPRVQLCGAAAFGGPGNACQALRRRENRCTWSLALVASSNSKFPEVAGPSRPPQPFVNSRLFYPV